MFEAILGSLATGLLNNAAASSRQEDAQEFSAQQFATRYQTTVKDMQAAGLNPMLAYSQGGGTPPSSAAASSVGTPDIGATISQSKLSSAQVANIAADTENKKAQAALIEAQTAETLASAQHKGTLVSSTEAVTQKIHEEIKNIKSENVRIEATINHLAEHTALMREQGKTEPVRRAELEQIVKKLKLENAITSADYEAMVKSNFIGRMAREVKPASDIAADWLSPGKWFKSRSETTVERKK